ncbi:hypothetical protein BH11PSE14_BH11PSE14_18340 [soil metagenome]
MSLASCCLRVLLMLSLALGGATPAMAAAAMLVAAPASAHAVPAGASHGPQCHHGHGAVEATQANAGSAMHSHEAAGMQAHHASMVKADATLAPNHGDTGCDCCDSGKCDCACMQGVPCMAIDVATLVSDVPASSSVDATLSDPHPEPARAQLIRPPTQQAA